MNRNALTVLLATALLLCSHLSATAQTDVTDQHLTNAGFDTAADFVSSIVYTYAKDGDVSSCQPISGWTPDATDDAKAGGAFGFGSGYGLSGAAYVVPATDADGNSTGGALGLAASWSNSVGYSQAVTLPKGLYRLSFMVFNAGANTIANYASTMGFVSDDGTEHYADIDFYSGEWTEAVVYLNLTSATNGSIHLGYTCANVGSAASPKLFVDYVKIEQLPPTDMLEDLTSRIDRDGWGGTGNYTAEGITAHEAFQWAASLNTGRRLGQQLTGLPNGRYSLTMLVGVSSTSGRDNTQNVLTDGSTAYASLHANDRHHGVPAYNREALSKFERITLNDIDVTDGTLDIWLNQDLTGPNWLVVQVQSLLCVRPIPAELRYTIGDVNEDGSITIADVTALVNIILGKSTDHKDYLADVNEDGNVTIADVTALVNIILGKAEAKVVDNTWTYADLDAMVYAQQSATENAAGPDYMLSKAIGTLTGDDVATHYDMADFLTTLNITTTLPDVASVSVYALGRERIAGPLAVSRRADEISYSYTAGPELIYANSLESDVVSVEGSNAGTYTAYLRPVSLPQGVKVTICTTDGHYYSQDFATISTGQLNTLPFTATTTAQNLWQSTIPGNTYFSMLSTPGAHDAATSSCSVSAAKCQSEDIAGLLANGVRAFDLRPRYTSNTQSDIELSNLTIYHGIVLTGVKFKDAIDILIDFVRQNPTEAVSVIMNKENSSSILSLTDQSETWRASMRECFGDPARSPYLMASVRGYHTLDDVRGKVSIVSRNPYGNSSNGYRDVVYGAIIENWPDDGVVTDYSCDMTQAWNWVDCRASVEDAYNSSTAVKQSQVQAQLQLAAGNTDHFHYCYTYTSIANNPASYAATMNPATVSIVSTLTGPLCYVYADYMGSQSNGGSTLLRAIVDQNYKYVFTGRSRK